MILESGEEILCGYASSVYLYLLAHEGQFVPMSGNRNYTVIRNLYNSKKNQFVTYKSID